jgi:predicted transcriptional regulator
MEKHKEDFEKAYRLLNAITHPQKLWILTQIKERGFLIGREIWQGLNLPQPVGSKFSNELVGLGLLRKERSGSSFKFFLIEESFDKIASLSAQIANLLPKQ